MSELQKKVDAFIAAHNGEESNPPTCSNMELRVRDALKNFSKDSRLGGFYQANLGLRGNLDDIPEEVEIQTMLAQTTDLSDREVFVKNHQGAFPATNQQNMVVAIDGRLFGATWRGDVVRPLMDPDLSLHDLFQKRLAEANTIRRGLPLPIWQQKKQS